MNGLPVSSSSGSVGGFAGVVRRIRKVRSTCMCVATASQNRSDRRGRRRRGDRELIRLFPQHYSVCVRFRCFVSLQRALHQLLDLQLLTGESTVCCSCAIEPKRGLIQILQASNSLEAGYGRSCWRVENSKSSLEDLYPKLP